MTVDDIKKALRECRSPGKCDDCPLKDNPDCITLLKWDALNAIEELQERIGIVQESMEALEKRCKALEALEQRCKTLEALEKRLADHDRIKVIRCADCAWWEANNTEEGDTSGYCRKNAECENALTDMTFFCGSADRR